MHYQRNEKSTTVIFLLSLLVCLGGGWLTGLFTQEGVREWYPHLIKSQGTPKDIVFPIVWTILYTFMAIALTLLTISKTTHKKTAFVFFFVQLSLNFIWSWLFFYLQSPGAALIDIVFLWLSLALTIVLIWRHTRVGGYLLLPYLAWVSYAFYLNLFVWMYN